jgi:quaternary ammonium compound-resistance protein SugE
MAGPVGGGVAGNRLGLRVEIFRRPHLVLADRATLVAIVFSFGLMAIALKSLPFGTAYAVWTGIGAAGSILVGMLVFSEPADPVRLLCLTLIVAGMVGLKLNSPV